MTGSQKKILIVEDYDDIAEIYSFLLKNAGYAVRISKDGAQTLEDVLDFKPDVILLDIMMPTLDGIEILKTIRNDLRYAEIQPRILVTTNILQQEISKEAAKYGADGYVVKANIHNKELVTIVEELIAKGPRLPQDKAGS